MRVSDKAYAILRDEIIGWELPPGTVLAEVEQASRLGVSRTPLREALGRLTADGLVEPQAGRGLVVSQVSIEIVVELFEARQALEQRAAALAAQRRDPAVFVGLQEEFRGASALVDDAHAYYDLVTRFDAAVDDAATSPYLVAALKGLRPHLARIRRLAQDDPDRLRAAASEHLLIVDAIVDGDPELASHATHVHLHRSLQNMLQYLQGAADGNRFATHLATTA